jgi:hypothetical protein
MTSQRQDLFLWFWRGTEEERKTTEKSANAKAVIVPHWPSSPCRRCPCRLSPCSHQVKDIRTVLDHKIALSLALYLKLIRSETFRSCFDHKIALIRSETLRSVLDHKFALIRSETLRSVLDNNIGFSLAFAHALELIRIRISHGPTSTFCGPIASTRNPLPEVGTNPGLAFPYVNKRADIRTNLAAFSRRRQTRSRSRRWERYLPEE